ncbi:MAG TPA: hypothetical protein VE591_15715 [Candidatus Acidoferrum sp.]|nr:hypothetical protein [Candidatus Acidoferrum sp.]
MTRGVGVVTGVVGTAVVVGNADGRGVGLAPPVGCPLGTGLGVVPGFVEAATVATGVGVGPVDI